MLIVSTSGVNVTCQFWSILLTVLLAACFWIVHAWSWRIWATVKKKKYIEIDRYHLTAKSKQETGDLQMLTWHHSLFLSRENKTLYHFSQIGTKNPIFLKMQGNHAVQSFLRLPEHKQPACEDKRLSPHFLFVVILFQWGCWRVNLWRGFTVATMLASVTNHAMLLYFGGMHMKGSVAWWIDHWTGTLETRVIFLALAPACWMILGKSCHLRASISPYAD